MIYDYDVGIFIFNCVHPKNYDYNMCIYYDMYLLCMMYM